MDNNNNLQTTGNHLLVFNRKGFDPFTVNVQSFNLPGITLGAIPGATYKITSYKIIGSTIDFGDLTCNIILDEKMDSYAQLFKWMMELTEPEDVNPVMYLDCASTANLHILTNNRAVQKLSINFYELWPQAIQDIQFSTTSTDEPNLIVLVTFKYRLFRLVKDGIEL
mgnify:CR=1 FL=1